MGGPWNPRGTFEGIPSRSAYCCGTCWPFACCSKPAYEVVRCNGSCGVACSIDTISRGDQLIAECWGVEGGSSSTEPKEQSPRMSLHLISFWCGLRWCLIMVVFLEKLCRMLELRVNQDIPLSYLLKQPLWAHLYGRVPV